MQDPPLNKGKNRNRLVLNFLYLDQTAIFTFYQPSTVSYGPNFFCLLEFMAQVRSARALNPNGKEWVQMEDRTSIYTKFGIQRAVL